MPRVPTQLCAGEVTGAAGAAEEAVVDEEDGAVEAGKEGELINKDGTSLSDDLIRRDIEKGVNKSASIAQSYSLAERRRRRAHSRQHLPTSLPQVRRRRLERASSRVHLRAVPDDGTSLRR